MSFGLILMLVLIGVIRVWGWIQSPVVDTVEGLSSHVPAAWLDLPGRAADAVEAFRITWRVLVEPVATPLVLFLFAMAAACMVCTVALNRVALGGASES